MNQSGASCTTGPCCPVCKLVGLLVIVGALNWGSIGAFQVNFVDNLLGAGSTGSRAVYILVGVAGILKILSCFKLCPCQKKTS